jgi:hypothetical protein
MKKTILSLVMFIITLLAVVSCYYDSEEALYPSLSSSCDTLNVTFSGTIAPILGSNCLSCHSNSAAASAGGNIRLQDYADVKAQNARIAGAVKQLSGFSPMPKNGGRLSDCSIRQFDTWVLNGMPGN